jgi:hypothetical protein
LVVKRDPRNSAQRFRKYHLQTARPQWSDDGLFDAETVRLKELERYSNSVRPTYLELREYNVGLAVQRPGQGYLAHGPLEIVRATRIDIQRTPSMGWCWRMDGKVRSARKTAEVIVGRLVDRVEGALRR